MKHIKQIASAVFLLLGLGRLQAQETPVASGGDAIGSGGTVSYAVGQVVYATDTGTNGSEAKGVQQPFEISVITGINELGIALGVSVYPNPTTTFLRLQVESEKVGGLSYQLVDLQGKIITGKRIHANAAIIKMENLPKAAYFLRINNNLQTVKIFKIIKR
ncbi:MAG: T9SS type A sorting domain-containing protein [Bacteroidota bacterium]